MKRPAAPKKSAEVTLTPGPRKQRRTGLPPPRFSHHKARSVWFQMRAAWPRREGNIAKLVSERARAHATLPHAPAIKQWQSIGPINVGGRLTSVVCDPANPDVIWAGSAGGGVWKSSDAGKTWTALWHSEASLNVGALAIDPIDKALYAGTGEADFSADSYPGVGLYRSADGGTTWTLLAPSDTTGVSRRIGTIAIDPFDSKHIRVGGVGYDSAGPGGMYVSRDRGSTWTRESFISSQNYWCHSIVFHPTREGTIYATCGEKGARSGVWRSRDGGQTWTHLTSGLAAPEAFDRATLAIAPSKPEVLYVIAANQRDHILGVFRSSNGGDTWSSIGGTAFNKEDQMTYNSAIAVHPTNPNRVICGGVDLHLTTDGGKSWKKVTRWDADRGAGNYAHGDHHALVMPLSQPGRIYDANDGGMDLSDDAGVTWTNRSTGLAVTMYYDVDVAPSDGRHFGGGTQDNGTNVTMTGRTDDHRQILGGDGGWMVYDPQNAAHLYDSWYNFGIFRFRNGVTTDVSPPAGETEQGSIWMAYITLHPSDSRTVFTGSRRIWRTTNDGASWKPVSPTLDNSAITAIEVAPAASSHVYVGTENGGFFRSLDGGNTWSENLKSAELPGFTITRIESSPVDANLLFVTVANAGTSHVFKSSDGGRHWEDVDRGRLPDVPHHALAIPPDRPQTLYVCNDAGVFVSPDLGGSWQNITRNLPNVMIVDLVYHTLDRTLTAATYGRSLWRLPVA